MRLRKDGQIDGRSLPISDEKRQKMSVGQRNQSEEARLRRSESAKKRWAKKEERDKQSKRTTEHFADPEILAKHVEKMTIVNRKLAPRISATLKAKWEDPEFYEQNIGNLFYKQVSPKWRAIQEAYSEYPEEYFKIRPSILVRDKNRCRMCHFGYKEGRRMAVHHIDWNKTNNSPDNLILLCARCHRKIHNCKNNEMLVWLQYKAGGICAIA